MLSHAMWGCAGSLTSDLSELISPRPKQQVYGVKGELSSVHITPHHSISCSSSSLHLLPRDALCKRSNSTQISWLLCSHSLISSSICCLHFFLISQPEGVKGSAQCQSCAVILTCFHSLHKNPHKSHRAMLDRVTSSGWADCSAPPLTRWLCLMKMMLHGCSSCPVQWARWQWSNLSGLICSFVQSAHLGLKGFSPKQDNAWAEDTLRCEHDIFGTLVKRVPLSPIYYFTFGVQKMGGK